jgi:hypothetical protein
MTKEQIEQIEEGDRLIAAFMGGKLIPTGNISHVNIYYWQFPNGAVCPEYKTAYHTSWDWLMPVVEKIESMYNYEKDKPFFTVDVFEIKWTRRYPDRECRVFISICTNSDGFNSTWHYIRTQSKSKIEAVWLAVVDFIKWFNQTQTSLL